MAASSSVSILLIVPLLFFIVILQEHGNGVAAVPIEELDAMNTALSNNGYNRIGNAIATSDLTFDFISADAVTLFAPSDSWLYNLDMTLTADSYVSILRCHAVPRRLSVSDLHLLPASSVLPTLISNSSLNFTVDKSDTVTVNGVKLEAPGIYNGSQVIVHGLSGALFLSGSDRRTILDPQVGYTAASPLPPAPPFEVPRATAAADNEAVYPLWTLPPEPSPFADLPLAVSQLPQTGPPARRRKLSSKTRGQSPAPAPANVNRRFRLPERVKIDKEAGYGSGRTTTADSGSSSPPHTFPEVHCCPYSTWNENDALCNRECLECRICLSRCSSCS